MKLLTLLLTIICSSFCALAQTPSTFQNPILSGFHPDPSITRKGDTYYLVNSSFEWFPALPIHKSKDLVNWELIGYGMDRPEQAIFDDKIFDSAGTYAPTIRYHEDKFYLICTLVAGGGNFILTSEDPESGWSDPIWLDTPGIDPSLYWEDGRCYYLGASNLEKDKTPWLGANGVYMQEIELSTGKMIGEPKQLTHGHATNARWTEGPHLYKIDEQYLLLVAEGGTGEFHAVTAFTSDSLWGEYIPNQVNPVMTHRHLGYTYPIIQTGHADMVQTPSGDWWSVMLAKRPVNGSSMLARETFLAKVEMTTQDGQITPMFNPGVGLLQLEQERPDLPWTPTPAVEYRDDFDGDKLALKWNFLRTPTMQWHCIKDGELKIDLRPEQITKFDNPSYIAQRVKSHKFTATTKMKFSTKAQNEMAGLVYYRNSKTHYQLLKSKDSITLIKSYTEYETNSQKIIEHHCEAVASVPYTEEEVVLSFTAMDTEAQFYYGRDKSSLQKIGELQDISIIGDEKALRFNGSYIGVYATSGGEKSRNSASFDYFEQIPIDAE